MSEARRQAFRKPMRANRVLRGGSWNNSAQNCRSAQRNANDPGNRNDNIGFRLLAAHPFSEEAADPAFVPAPAGRDRGTRVARGWVGRLDGRFEDPLAIRLFQKS
ncbi:MAG: SUMF1/EgtB/PvdO family nonheme iron enzyme [Verrucomicrobiota bacterium]